MMNQNMNREICVSRAEIRSRSGRKVAGIDVRRKAAGIAVRRKVAGIAVRRMLALSMCMLLLITVAGCGKKKDEDAAMQETIFSAAGTITLYHVQGRSVEADTERYQLKQPDSLSASVEEVALAIHLPEGITFDSYSIDADKVIHLTLVVKDSVPEETRLLAKVAIVRSMNGLSEAKSYVIELITETGDLIEEAPYNDDSFYYYETGDE